MQKTQTVKTGWYIFSDVIASVIAWTVLTHKRKIWLYEEPMTYQGLFNNYNFFYSSLFFAIIFWVILFAVSGAYNQPLYKKSRLKETTISIIQCLIGSILLLFILFLNDRKADSTYLNDVFFTFAVLQALLVIAGRLILISIAHNNAKKIPQFFNTVIIGNNAKAVAAYKEIKRNRLTSTYNLLGFITDESFPKNGISKNLPCLGMIEETEKIIHQKNINQVVVALEKSERIVVETLISRLSECDVEIKMVPDSLAIITGSVKMRNVPDAVLIDVNTAPMPAWQNNIKRLFDVSASVIALIVLSPLLAYVALRTKLSSEGYIIYNQQRIGYKGKPFYIHKFRSMYADAEKNGPALSSENDPRITKWGRIMRKWRLDELPQLWNILKGEMSFVGPRPRTQILH